MSTEKSSQFKSWELCFIRWVFWELKPEGLLWGGKGKPGERGLCNRYQIAGTSKGNCLLKKCLKLKNLKPKASLYTSTKLNLRDSFGWSRREQFNCFAMQRGTQWVNSLKTKCSNLEKGVTSFIGKEGRCESWALKTAEHRRIYAFKLVLEKTLQSLLDCKEIKSVNPKGNQCWLFIGRTDAEAETPILWPPDAKSQLIRKNPDEDWGQEEKRVTDNETVGRHHRLKGQKFEPTLGDSEGQGSLAFCSP